MRGAAWLASTFSGSPYRHGAQALQRGQTVGLTLLHVDLADHLPAEVARVVLQGYQGRYSALKDAVTETVPDFDDGVLATFDLAALLTEPVYVLADQWPRLGRSGAEPATRSGTEPD